MKWEQHCDLCSKSSRKGLLWLGGGDWVECPDCGGTGVDVAYADYFTPKERTVSIAGIGTFVQRWHHPVAKDFI